LKTFTVVEFTSIVSQDNATSNKNAKITLGNANPNMLLGSKPFKKLYNLRTVNYEVKNTITPNFNNRY
jgi:hypothetical protein